MTWMIGGVGLIVSGVLGFFADATFGSSMRYLLLLAGDVVYAAAALIFAVGLTRSGSVVARGIMGVASISVFALWPLVAHIVAAPAPATADGSWEAFQYVSILVPAASGALAVTEIVRARVVTSPWRWLPLCVFLAAVAVWIVPQLASTAVGAAGAQSSAGVMSALGMLTHLAATIGLGIVAVFLSVEPGRAPEQPSRAV